MDLTELESKYKDGNFDPDDSKEIDVDLDTLLSEHGVFDIDQCKDGIKMILQNHYGNLVMDWVSS